MSSSTNWQAVARVNPQGAVLHFLKEHPRGRGLGWTAAELAVELSLPLSRVRRELIILRGCGLIAPLATQSHSGSRLWRAD
jgi:DNA-binding IclR family transcriptional regulator